MQSDMHTESLVCLALRKLGKDLPEYITMLPNIIVFFRTVDGNNPAPLFIPHPPAPPAHNIEKLVWAACRIHFSVLVVLLGSANFQDNIMCGGQGGL